MSFLTSVYGIGKFSVVVMVSDSFAAASAILLSIIYLPKHLQSEIEDLLSLEDNDAPLQKRVRRSPDDDDIVNDEHFKCKQQSKKSCCGKTNLFKHFGDQNKTLGKSCYEEISERLKQGKHFALMRIRMRWKEEKNRKKLKIISVRFLIDCQLSPSSLPSPFEFNLTEIGNINVDEMKKYLTNDLFKEDWQKEQLGKILPKCMNEKYVEWPENEPGVRCNPLAVQFHHCLWKEFEIRSNQNVSYHLGYIRISGPSLTVSSKFLLARYFCNNVQCFVIINRYRER
ncbi:hypothetical protein PGB90_003265 [Kerria lacca]